LSGLPTEVLRAVGVLALFGALYGSFKALGQTRVPELLAYTGLAFYSALWWHLTLAGGLPFPSLIYATAVALLTAGLLLAWQRLRRRYGHLTLERMHGLARPMPRFATVFALLVMASVGLPPFGLFFGQVEMLLQPSTAISSGLAIVLLGWFLASWYLFRMMQRLLFGPHRIDLRYEDLRAGEIGYFAALLVIVVILGSIPLPAIDSGPAIGAAQTSLETILWRR
jgi:NADH-quinone oxidoreductase subunit M